MGDSTVVIADPTISIGKSLTVLIQAGIAYGLSYASLYATKKSGIALDVVTLQPIVTGLGLAIIHGAWNFITHLAPKK